MPTFQWSSYCWRLERKLSVLRQGQAGLREAAGELAQTVAQAEAAVRGLKLTAADAGRDLQARIDEANRLAERIGLGMAKVRASTETGRSSARGW